MFTKLFLNLRKKGFIYTIKIIYYFFVEKVYNIFKKISYKPEPYEFVENDVVNNLNCYIKKQKNEIKNIIIVGAHHAYEVKYLQKNFHNCNFKLFEASPRHIEKLTNIFLNNKNILIYPKAVSNTNGILIFYETNLTNSGSILKTADLASKSFGMIQKESYEVEAVTLNKHSLDHNYHNTEIDCLWIDVQGAEFLVLEGASEILSNVRSIFIEISLLEPLYENGAVFKDINNLLILNNFILFSLGTDYNNGTGNAFFVKKDNNV
jgi:FkbM family methyltransferase